LLLATGLSLGCSTSERHACVATSIGTLAAGTLAVVGDGALWLWGARCCNGQGHVPPEVLRSSADIIAVSSRSDEVCEVHRNGSLLCWGPSLSMQLTDAAEVATSPANLKSDASSCVLHQDGQLDCFDATAFPVAPRSIPGLPASVAAIALGDPTAQEGCAITSDGAAYCWGAGILGDGSDPQAAPAPATEIVALRGQAQRVALSRGSKCVVTIAGSVLCWGPLLDPTTPALSPVAVVLPAAATMLAMGDDHACALTSDGRVYCWGDNSQGQTSGPDQGRSPRKVPLSGAKVAEVVTGAQHSCARTQDGTVSCWGSNSAGQLGVVGLAGDRSEDPVALAGCK
jgi:alpha-tubulin suppressor-like RCC1 family protein